MALPSYMLVMSLVFTISVPLIMPASFYNQIGGLIDKNIAFLSVIVFSNVFFIEKQLHTAEVFYLIPGNGAFSEIYSRMVIKGIFLLMVVISMYGLYLLGKPHLVVGDSLAQLFFQALFAICSSILFWGVLSCSIVNITSNLWAGLAITIVFWFIENSTLAQKLPIYLNMFAYAQLNESGNQISNWFSSKLVGDLLAIIFVVINRILIKKSPCRN
jgi:hypothetical protein